MPFTVEDVETHTKKATTAKLKRQWVNVANSVLRQCLEDGGTDETCAPKAIKRANGVIAKAVQEATMPMTDISQIAQSAIETALAVVKGTGEITPERAVKLLHALESDLQEARRAVDVTEATTKTVGGEKFPASDFLVVEDPEQPSTWHLQVKQHGKPDHRLMGGAKAALTSPGGHRGRKYAGPNKAEATRKLKALYKAEDMPWGDETEEAMIEIDGSLRDEANQLEDLFHTKFSPKDRWEGPYSVRDVFAEHPDLGNSVVVFDRTEGKLYVVDYDKTEEGTEFALRNDWREVVLSYKPVGETPAEESASLTESITGATMAGDVSAADLTALKESGVQVGEGRRAPVLVDFRVIKPGPGNKRDGHYYPASVLKRDIHVFEGVDVFATDHKEGERSERTKVGRVRACPVSFQDGGAPVGRVIVYDPDLAEKTRNRADAGELETMECSIYGTGQAKPGKVDGQEYKVVEAITEGKYLELVSKAGAGGHAIGLAESDGGNPMEDEKKPKPEETQAESGQVEEVNLAEQGGQGGQQPPIHLEEAQVETTLSEARLPDPVKALLKLRQYADEAELKAAIAEMIEAFKEATGSGKPTVKRGGAPAAPTTRSLQEVQATQNAINQKWLGGRPVKQEVKQNA